MNLKHSPQDLIRGFYKKSGNQMFSKVKGIEILWRYMNINHGFLESCRQQEATHIVMSELGDLMGNTRTQIKFNIEKL